VSFHRVRCHLGNLQVLLRQKVSFHRGRYHQVKCHLGNLQLHQKVSFHQVKCRQVKFQEIRSHRRMSLQVLLR
jgi:hypothetical protein